jgi:hypothetical protein
MKQTIVIAMLVLIVAACQTTRTRFSEAASYGFDKRTINWSDGDASEICPSSEHLGRVSLFSN